MGQEGHTLRSRRKFSREFRTVTEDLRPIYQAVTEDAAMKLLWLALRNAEKKWTYPLGRPWGRRTALPVRKHRESSLRSGLCPG